MKVFNFIPTSSYQKSMRELREYNSVVQFPINLLKGFPSENAILIRVFLRRKNREILRIKALFLPVLFIRTL